MFARGIQYWNTNLLLIACGIQCLHVEYNIGILTCCCLHAEYNVGIPGCCCLYAEYNVGIPSCCCLYAEYNVGIPTCCTLEFRRNCPQLHQPFKLLASVTPLVILVSVNVYMGRTSLSFLFFFFCMVKDSYAHSMAERATHHVVS